MAVFWVVILAITSIAIVFQDYKTRLIDLWLLLIYAVVNCLFYLQSSSIIQLFHNVLFCLSYFVLTYFVLLVYFYFKEKSFVNIINTKIGLGDLLVFLGIGCGLPAEVAVYFFTSGFILSLIFHTLFIGSSKSVPLAANFTLIYLLYLMFLK